ncbi:hypothetical protein JKG47_03535 [Acidithiobacillus sp. MC6.1]|nr:hypothetical protein [Acidithiobacillus sp. MC6.1]
MEELETKLRQLVRKVDGLLKAELIPSKDVDNYKGGMAYVMAELKLVLDTPAAAPATLAIEGEKEREKLAAIVRIMREHHCDTLSVEYSGAGDELDEISVSHSDGELTNEDRKLIENAVHNLISSSIHDGFWNDDGGHGTIDFSLPGDSLAMAWGHFDYVVEEKGHIRVGLFRLAELEAPNA